MRPARRPLGGTDELDDAPAEGDVTLVGVTVDELAAIRAAVILAEEALGKALLAIQRHEGSESGLARELGSALEALATTEDDVRRAAVQSESPAAGTDPDDR